MEIILQLTNVNNATVKGINLKKFFPIIFFNENMKRIDIYVASVIGGEENVASISKADEFISGLNSDFNLKFDVIIKNQRGEATITHKNLTTQFIEQIEKTKMIWGEDSKSGFATTHEVGDHLKLVFENHKNKLTCKINGNCNECKLKTSCPQANLGSEIHFAHCQTECKDCIAYEVDEKLLRINLPEAEKCVYICDKKKKEYAVCYPIDYSCEGDNQPYKIRSPFPTKLLGMDLISWVHTKIEFDTYQNLDHTKYSIKLNGVEDSVVFAPDFTIYIGPPVGYSLNLSSSTCKYGGSSVRDFLQEVGNYDQLYYTEWKEECNISDKTMYRVLKEKIVSTEDKKLNGDLIELVLNIKDESNKDRLKFYFGIFISAILAFGIDFTRILSIEKCFLPFFLSPDLQWISTCLLIMASFFQRQREKIVKKDNNAKIWWVFSKRWANSLQKSLYRTGNTLIFLWFFAVFVIYQNYKNNYGLSSKLIMLICDNELSSQTLLLVRGSFGVGFLSLMIYYILSITLFKSNYSSKKGLWHSLKDLAK